jgi:hypothetical protein
MHPRGLSFFSFGGRVKVLDFFFPPMCSHKVPNSSPLYSISFALGSTSCNLHKKPKRQDYNIFILGVSKALLLLFCDESIKNAHYKKKKMNFEGP